MHHSSSIAVLVLGLFVVGPFDPIVAREAVRPTSAGELLARFRASDVFYHQHDIARTLIARHERSALPELVPHLRAEDRHVRANAALVFVGLGDPRGFDVRTTRRCCSASSRTPEPFPALIPLLEQPEVNFGAVFALGEMAGQQAVTALIKRLSDRDPSIRVLAIRALAHLHSKEAIPAIYRLLNDEDTSHVDDLVSVGEAAREALVQLGADPGQ